MQPNRIERNWLYIIRRLQRTYPLVPEGLWEPTGRQHDHIVRLVRDTYAPGRSELSVEAEVRDLLNQWCNENENL